MKKTDKMILRVFVSFLVVGCVVLAAGIAMGAKPHEYLSLQLGKEQVSLLGDGFWGIGGSIDTVETVENEQRFSAKEIEKLKFNIDSGAVEISPTSGEEIICYSNRGVSFYRQKGNSLILEDEGLTTPIKLKIYLPEKVWEEVEMELGACSVYLESLEARKMSLEMGAGHLEAVSLEAEKNMDIQVGTGLVEVERCLAGKLGLECGMGSMEICMEGSGKDYNYRLECGMGNLQLGADGFAGLGGERTVDNGAARQINAECGMGNLLITFTEE